MKKILCVLSSLDAGGAETFLMKIYRSLPPEEYQFDFIVSAGDGCYTEEVLSRGGKIYHVPLRTKSFFGAFFGILSVVKQNNYHTVLKLAEHSLAAADLLAAKLGGARSLVLRSCNAPTGLSFKSKCIHALFKPLLNTLSTVKLAPSQLAADFMFGKRSDVRLINNGVDLDVFHFDKEARERIRKAFELENKTVVGHIGRFAEQKNHMYLLKVFEEMHRKCENSILLLIGTGHLEEQVRNRVSELGLQEYVIFAGQRFDIPELLSAMDVFVFPSLHEGMPNTVIEAQATGLPCVIADTITPEADITGLVQYLPLSEAPGKWAETALSAVAEQRRDTAQDFREHGYDIKCVAKELVELICG